MYGSVVITERAPQRWIGVVFAVLVVITGSGTLFATADGEWLKAARGAALTGIFLIVVLVRLKWRGSSPAATEVLDALLMTIFVALLVVDYV
jgi:hypothetical protein